MTEAITTILVGGFLGAGKTTLLAQAARRLAARGKRAGLITNDQAADLVDTAVLRQVSPDVQEIAGGCFCCRFPDLVAAMKALVDQAHPDVILAEPVGSCTDLSATVLQPVKQLYGTQFRVAPFSVLADPQRLAEALGQGPLSTLDAKIMYIFRIQLEESDAIVINKCDLVSAAELAQLKALVQRRYPARPVFVISSLRGDGVDEWLDFVLSSRPAGQRIATVDYDVYAEGEAALGWLNATVQLRSAQAVDWRALGTQLAQGIADDLRPLGCEIAHLKLLLSGAEARLQVNLTSGQARPAVQGDLPAGTEAGLILNARVHSAPGQLQTIVENRLRQAAGASVEMKIIHISSLSPGRPQPAHRYDRVV